MAKFSLIDILNRAIYVLKFLCLYPSPEENSFITITRTIIIHGIFICPFVFNQVAKLVISFDDLDVFVNACYVTTYCLAAIIKNFYLMYHHELLVNTCNGIQENKPKMNEEQEKIITDYMQWWRKFHVFNGLIVPAMCSLFWNIEPLLNPQGVRLPFLTWYPYDVNGTWAFPLTYLHQVISITLILYINLDVDVLMGGLMAYTAGECMVLENCLENIQEMTKLYFDVKDEDVEVNLSATLSKLVIFHRNIRKFGLKVEKLYNAYNLLQLVIEAPSLAMTMFMIIQLENYNSLEMAGHCMYILGILLDVFTYCWFGNEVTNKSSRLAYAAFKCEWHDAPQSFKKDLLYFTHMSQSPIRMSVMFIFEFNMQTYMSILRTAYSYCALLQRVS